MTPLWQFALVVKQARSIFFSGLEKKIIDFFFGAYLENLETSETTEDVLERREELEDVCPIGNAHLTMVFNQERF